MNDYIETNVTGTVTTYNPDEGYGFITTLDLPDTAGASHDVFFHISELSVSTVEEGWRFRFDVAKNSQGYRAEQVQLISRGSQECSADPEPRHGINKHDSPAKDIVRTSRADDLLGAEANQNDTDDSEDDDSPFDDDIRGSKNGLL